MNALILIILELVKSGLNGSKTILPDNIKWEELINICNTHKLIPIIYHGLINSETVLPDSISEKFQKIFIQNVFADQKQLAEFSKIQAGFEKNNIDYLPLKGLNLKSIYPHSEMRPMGDCDILIRLEQYDKIKDIMLQLNYTEKKETAHEYVFVKNNMYVELHKCLIPPYNKDYYGFFKNGWCMAHKNTKQTSLYNMNDNDEFIFLFVHFAKHYRDGGISVLHMIDLWIYLKNKNVDLKYVKQKLADMKLDVFCNNVLNTLNVWFENERGNDVTNHITVRMFLNGCWGTNYTQYMSDSVKISKSTPTKYIKIKKIVKTIFPSAYYLRYRYPIVSKYVFLLPVFWIIRWIETVIKKPNNIKTLKNLFMKTSEKDVLNYQNELTYVGLDYDFNNVD